MRGRRKQDNSFTETISIKVTKAQKEVIKDNPFIIEEIVKQSRSFINCFVDSSKIRN